MFCPRKYFTRRTDYDPSDQLLVISAHNPYMTYVSLDPISRFAPFSAVREARGVAQKLLLDFSGPRSRFFFGSLGPTGLDKSSLVVCDYLDG